MEKRREEILAKQARLAELKRQRALRAQEGPASRQSIGNSSDIAPSSLSYADSKRDIYKFIDDLIPASRSGSTGQGSPARRGSRPNSVRDADEAGVETSDPGSPASGSATNPNQRNSVSIQTLATVPLATVYEFTPSPVKEVFSYSKAVQTSDQWEAQPSRARASSESENDNVQPEVSTPAKRLSRREREREEELRQNLRREIEEELKATRDYVNDGNAKTIESGNNFPVRPLTHEELNAVTSSNDFMDFVERSTKVIERALDQEYDILADYSLSGMNGVDGESDEFSNSRGKGRRWVREIAQFYDERWSRKRMVSDVNYSQKFPELVLASYTKNPAAPHDPDGLVQVWNLHLHDRPEYVFHAQSDVLTAKFSPFHPNLIIGGAYSGQVLLWDTRAKSAPVLKTPLTGSGHTHPVYAVDIVGTQNANNIISCSTDGIVCGWSVDMLAQPQELLALTTPPPSKTEDLSPTSMAFPQTDPTYFLVGSEEGTIFPCHRYDRAGAKAGVDQRVSYRGHSAPVMSVDFHPARGPIDLGDLVLSSSLDWTVKLWKIRAPAATSTTGITGEPQVVAPILDLSREDIVYDASWSPVKPGVFALVDGSGSVEVWDLTIDTEVPIARTQPSTRVGGRAAVSKSLNKVTWDGSDGKRLATGGLDGSVTIFEVGPDLGGKDSARHEEWTSMKKLVSRVEASNGDTNGI